MIFQYFSLLPLLTERKEDTIPSVNERRRDE
jgi:hypothetical protein